MPGPPLGVWGLVLVVVRLGLLRLSGPEHPPWVDQSLRLEWWVLQPALWAASAKQASNLRATATELQRLEAEAQAAASRARAGCRAAVAVSAGSLGLAAAATVAAARAGEPVSPPQPWPPLCPVLPAAPAPEMGGAGRLAAFAGGLACGGVALAAARSLRRRRPLFQDQVQKELLPHCARRTVTIQCPGVLRGDVVVNVLPGCNGAEVALSRRSARSLPAGSWRKTYSFPWREGTYECRQEALVLESGLLSLVFEADAPRERTLRVPQPVPALAFSMAGGDIPTPPCESSVPDQEYADELAGCPACTEPSPTPPEPAVLEVAAQAVAA